MNYLLLILFIWTTTNALETPVNSTPNVRLTVQEEGDNTTPKPLKIDKSANINVNSTTLSTSDLSLSSSTSDLSSTTPQSINEVLLSKNLTNTIPKPSNDNLRNDSINKSAMVMTEGGNSVSTVSGSVTSFQNSKDTSSKRILSDSSEREIISGSVLEKKNATQNLAQFDDNSKLQNAEGISSMNKGKITARKGVNDLKPVSPVSSNINEKTENPEPITHPPLVILKDDKPLTTINTNISRERMSKPMVTDVSNESSIYPSKKMDYIVSIMCTAFSIPLLIVLAVYLYKKGADFWERRHYNRMDFLIEGIYNE